jgi:hypothetical protein
MQDVQAYTTSTACKTRGGRARRARHARPQGEQSLSDVRGAQGVQSAATGRRAKWARHGLHHAKCKAECKSCYGVQGVVRAGCKAA